MSKTDKVNRTAKDDIINLSDLIYMDQDESLTSERPLTFSGKHTEKNIYILSIFVVSIARNIFCEF